MRVLPVGARPVEREELPSYCAASNSAGKQVTHEKPMSAGPHGLAGKLGLTSLDSDFACNGSTTTGANMTTQFRSGQTVRLSRSLLHRAPAGGEYKITRLL